MIFHSYVSLPEGIVFVFICVPIRLFLKAGGVRLSGCLSILFSIDMDQKLPAPGASITTNMHTDAALDMEQLFKGPTGV